MAITLVKEQNRVRHEAEGQLGTFYLDAEIGSLRRRPKRLSSDLQSITLFYIYRRKDKQRQTEIDG